MTEVSDGLAAAAAINVEDNTPDILDSIWEDKYIILFKDNEGKDRWRCDHCGVERAGKSQPKVLTHLTGQKSRSASCKVSNRCLCSLKVSFLTTEFSIFFAFEALPNVQQNTSGGAP